MSAPIVFILVFLSAFGITIWIPGLPPAEILYNLLGIPEITYDVFGFSGEVLVNGILNGALWGLFIALIYGLGRRASKTVVLMPVKATLDTPTPTSAPAAEPLKMRPPPIIRRSTSDIPIKTSDIPIKTSDIPIRSTQKKFTTVPLTKDIETIEGIGPKYGSMLRYYDIKDLEDLLKAGSTGLRRRELAKKVGVSPKKIFSWVNKADFSRIRGVGSQYAGLLDATGVTTVIDLAWRNPQRLYEKVRQINLEKHMVKRTPPHDMVQGWIQSAKSLQRIVEY